MAETAKQPKHCSVPELKSRGWTQSLIGKYLGEADATRKNPHYRSASPMKLYLRERVEAVEATEQFRAALKKAEQRKVSAKKAVATKTKLTLRKAQTLPVTVEQMPLEELLERAIASYTYWKEEWPECKPWDQKDEFRDRICVNYLRHEATDYHENLG